MDISWGEVALRFAVGGALVAVCSLVGEVMRPKGLAGVFGGAPSVATASLMLTLIVKGTGPIPDLMVGMMIGAAAFVVYTLAVMVLMRSVTRLSRFPSILLAWAAWVAVVAVALWRVT